MNLAEEERRKREILERLGKGPRTFTPVTLDETDLEDMRLQGSAYDEVTLDPSLRRVQMDAIDRFGEIADKGYTDAEAAAMQRARTEANRDDASRRASIAQQMQMRGGGGGGAELAMALQSADMAAERESQAAMDAAARGQQRGLEALRQRGAMAASLSDDEWQQKARAADARDQIQRFNSNLTQSFRQGNMQAQNQAGQWNAGAQNDWNWNTSKLGYDDAVQSQNRKIAEDQARKEAKRRKNAGMLGTAGAIAGGVIGTTIAPGLGTAAGATLGQSLGSGLGDVFSDERLKKNIGDLSPDDVDEFIASLQPKKFDYGFESREGSGPSRVGVIAQDVEENPIGSRVVKDTPDGKALDDDNLLGAILASLKRLDDKKRDK